ncbi:hypothetical protein EGK68_25765, partial [Enterobacter cloacae]
NINAGHEITSKARIIHQIQLIRGITIPILFIILFKHSSMPKFLQPASMVSKDCCFTFIFTNAFMIIYKRYLRNFG